jgi:sugar phosphate isomerase/epimerase
MVKAMTFKANTPAVALSTMVCATISDSKDWLTYFEELGNPALELDFHIGDQQLLAILGEVERGNISVASVHNCNPKFVGTPQRYNTGLADLDPAARAVAIEDFKFSLELAARCAVGFCVGPLGRIEPVIREENRLRTLYRHARDSDEYRQLQRFVISARAERVEPHLDALRDSLDRLAPICERLGVKFVPENRYEYGKLGLPEEIRALQAQYPSTLGYCHDFGHAMSVDCLGLWPDEDPLRPSLPVDIWHVNDFEVETLIDHLPLGQGDLEIDRVKEAVKSGGSVAVIEIRPHHEKSYILEALDTVRSWLQQDGSRRDRPTL